MGHRMAIRNFSQMLCLPWYTGHDKIHDITHILKTTLGKATSSQRHIGIVTVQTRQRGWGWRCFWRFYYLALPINEIDDRINQYQSIKLVNWYWLVSANRWPIDSHKKKSSFGIDWQLSSSIGIGRVFTSGFFFLVSDNRKSRENSCSSYSLKVKWVGKLQCNSH